MSHLQSTNSIITHRAPFTASAGPIVCHTTAPAPAPSATTAVRLFFLHRLAIVSNALRPRIFQCAATTKDPATHQSEHPVPKWYLYFSRLVFFLVSVCGYCACLLLRLFLPSSLSSPACSAATVLWLLQRHPNMYQVNEKTTINNNIRSSSCKHCSFSVLILFDVYSPHSASLPFPRARHSFELVERRCGEIVVPYTTIHCNIMCPIVKV